jgi:hypothetical protein
MAIPVRPVTGIDKFEGGIVRIFLVVINDEGMLMYYRTGETYPCILIPPPTLKKIPIGGEKKDKEQKIAIVCLFIHRIIFQVHEAIRTLCIRLYFQSPRDGTYTLEGIVGVFQT